MVNSDLKEQIKELMIVLREIESPILNKLTNGIDLVHTELIVTPPLTMIDLYVWSNGIKINSGDLIGQLQLFTCGIFMPIKRAVIVNSELSGNQHGWSENKFPIFESGYGEYLLIDCDHSSKFYEMIYHHNIGSVDYDKIITKYDSLTTLFKTICECYRKGIYFYENNFFEEDAVAAYEIGKANNPHSEYWKLFT